MHNADVRGWKGLGIGIAFGMIFVVGVIDDFKSISAKKRLVLQAMAANVPVVTTNAGGLDEVVKDDQNGVIVPVRQSRPLADGVRRLLREPETARRLARAARRTVEQNFTVAHMVEKTLALYEGLLA